MTQKEKQAKFNKGLRKEYERDCTCIKSGAVPFVGSGVADYEAVRYYGNNCSCKVNPYLMNY